MSKNISAEVSWFDRVIKRFKEVGTLIPHRQEKLYTKIRDEYAMGNTIVDVGCSLGVGSNILSHYARHVWGLDINEEAIKFADLAFKRPNLEFQVMDIEQLPTKRLAQLDIITMIETIEHLENPQIALDNLKRFFHDKSVGFITAPNVANEEVKNNEEKHGLHLNHWTAGEFYKLMIDNFQSVVMYSVDKLDRWRHDETVDGDSEEYLIVCKVRGIK